MIDLTNQIKNIMASVFEMNKDEISEDAAPGIVENWDSLRHMNLIVALEEEFEIRFTDDEISDLLNFVLIRNIMQARLYSDNV